MEFGTKLAREKSGEKVQCIWQLPKVNTQVLFFSVRSPQYYLNYFE